MIKLHVMPLLLVEHIRTFHKDTLVISITSPGQPEAEIKGEKVFRFQFHDVTEEYFLENRNQVIRPMEKEIAEAIIRVILNNKECDRWVIHCEAGISRSPGIAIGLAKYFEVTPTRIELEEQYPCFNKHVCRLIEEAIEKENSNEQVK